MKTQITWKEQVLDVDGNHYEAEKGDLFISPPISESFEINSIHKDGIDVTDIVFMVPDALAEIEQLILEDIKNEK